jgi:SWI/SNF-related matrix-associated actin-dependent regulator 1 of chromatin subfamily A
MIEIRRLGPRGLLGIFSTNYSPVLREECRRVPGMVWNPETMIWEGYADAVGLAANRSRERGLRIGEPAKLDVGSILPVAKKDLRDYQIEGVDFILGHAAEGCILADGLGLGKTCQALRAARAIKGNTLVVCPSFVRGVWVDELKKWWPGNQEIGEGVFLPSGTKSTPLHPSPSIVVIHYDILHAWVDVLKEWGPKFLILDEGQYVSNPTSRRTKACAAIGAPYRVALTGTPMANRPRDLWGLAEVVSPGRFGKFFAYGLKYCAGTKEQLTPEKAVWKFDGASNLEELQTRINHSSENPGGFMLRRTKADVGLQLPARQRQVLSLEVPRARFTPSQVSSPTAVRTALEAASDAKLPQVIDLVVAHLENGHKVVVGTHRKVLAHLILEGVRRKMPVAGVIITGEIPTAKRHALIKSQPTLICCTFDSTQVGIDLSFASVGVVAEFDYRPSVLSQWEGRFGRFAGKNVLIQYCSAKGTVDDLIRKAVIGKLDTLESAVGKADVKMREDLEAIDGASGIDRLRALAESLMNGDDE